VFAFASAAPRVLDKRHADISFLFLRGSKFLKKWMEFLEEHADLRYPDVAEVNRE
jgi:DNA polymerase alpha-associated DNA helicase A